MLGLKAAKLGTPGAQSAGSRAAQIKKMSEKGQGLGVFSVLAESREKVPDEEMDE